MVLAAMDQHELIDVDSQEVDFSEPTPDNSSGLKFHMIEASTPAFHLLDESAWNPSVEGAKPRMALPVEPATPCRTGICDMGLAPGP